jgi:alpha-ribazole phosphatase/probable phosphoglycerate mutase
MTNTTLDFLRHGEPVGGKKYRGQTDDPLSEKGWAQMRAATVGEQPWSAIVSSPLSRCQDFANWLSETRGLPMQLDARLAEVGFGVWEGKTAEQLKQLDPDCISNFKRDPVANRPQGAEPLADFSARVVAAYEDMLQGYAGRHVLVVAHAGVIRMAICHALGLSPEQAYRINVGSAGMARIRIENNTGQRFDSLMWLSKGG